MKAADSTPFLIGESACTPNLPPVPVTPPPSSGQAVGFGMENDLMELRLELEQMKHKTDRSK